MELVYDSYQQVIEHYRISKTRFKSAESNKFYLFGLILFTEGDIDLIEMLFRNISELHFATGDRILLMAFIPKRFYPGKAKRKVNIKSEEARVYVADSLTEQSYSLIEQYGIPRTSLPCIVFFEKERFDSPFILGLRDHSFSDLIYEIREVSDKFYAINREFFDFKIQEHRLGPATWRKTWHNRRLSYWRTQLHDLAELERILKDIQYALTVFLEARDEESKIQVEELIQQQLSFKSCIYKATDSGMTRGHKRYSMLRPLDSPRANTNFMGSTINRNASWINETITRYRKEMDWDQQEVTKLTKEIEEMESILRSKHPQYLSVRQFVETSSANKSLAKIKNFSRFLELKPNVFGIGINLNQVVDDLFPSG